MIFQKYLIVVKVLVKTLKFFFLKNFFTFENLLTKEINFKKKVFGPEFIFKYGSYIFKSFRINSCFTKSLVIKELLQENGYNANIEIGVKKQEGKLISHCWVVSDNLVNESKEVRESFKVLDT